MNKWRWLSNWLARETRPALPPAVFSGESAELPAPARAPALLRNQPPAQLFTPALLRQAWLTVKAAGGGPGVDGETLADVARCIDDELAHLREELINGHYRPRPLRQVLAPKASGGLRPIVIWAVRDRIAQRAIYELLAPIFDPLFLPCSFGFRSGLRVEDAVQQLIARRNANLRWVVDADIQNCFDSINHQRLLQLVRRHVHHRLVLHYVSAWLNADLLTSMDGRPRKAGASQGGVLSPLLANLYLHEFDQALARQALALLRYADDYVICCRRKEEAQMAYTASVAALGRLGLVVHPQKSRIVHFDQGFTWLGYFFIRNECHRL